MTINKIDVTALEAENRFHCNQEDVPGKSAKDMKDFFDYVTKEEVIPKVNEIVEAVNVKAEADTVYTKTETDALVSPKADADTVYTKTETDALVSPKADADTVYTKTETDALVSPKADADTVYTKTETDQKLDQKLDVNTAALNFANSLKGTASGAVVTVDDTSPVEHTLGVKVESKNLYNNQTKSAESDLDVTTGELTANSACFTSDYIPVKPSSSITINYAKNWAFYNKDKAFVSASDDESSAIQRTISVPSKAYYIRFSCLTDTNDGTGVQLEYGTEATDYTSFVEVEGLPLSAYGKNRIDITTAHLNSTNTAWLKNVTTDNNTLRFEKMVSNSVSAYVNVYAYLEPGTYKFSGIGTTDGSGNMCYVIFNPDGTQQANTRVIGQTSVSFAQNVTATQSGRHVFCMYIGYDAANGSYVSYENLLLEKGSTKTDYTPFVSAQYASNADGTIDEVTSIYPSMSLVPDADGVILDVEYNRDINKAFAELTQAITSLGGTV